MRKALHIILLVAIVIAVFAVPYRAFIGPIRLSALFGGGVDATTSASVILDAPSGNYVVLLNAARHDKFGSTADWEDFFRGESPLIMDDIDCAVIRVDAGGIEMADSYRSRLPENQMKLTAESAEMLLSKAQAGLFDAIVMTKECAEAFRADTVYGVENVKVIEVGVEA